jgi:pimeloyl-ACP methyl ester carboxylesterase
MLPDLTIHDHAGHRFGFREAGRGPVLLLSHGIGSGSSSWEAQFDAFADRYRVIAWDVPGYGGTDGLVADRPVPADYAAVLLAFTQALELPPFHLVGHSLSGLITAAFARRHPERLLSLTLSHPAAGYGSQPAAERAARRDGRLRDIAELGPAGLAEKRARLMVAPGAGAEAVAKAQAVMAMVKPRGYAQATECLAAADIFDDAPAIRTRTQVLAGGYDGNTPPESCRAIAEAIPGAAYYLVATVAHAPYLEDPATYNQILGQFLKG